MQVPARELRSAPRWIAAAGFLAAALTVLAGGRDGTVGITIPLTTWLGLLSPHGYRPGDSWLPGGLLFVGIAALVLLWLGALRWQSRMAWTERQVWWIAAAWAAPFVVGPPLISRDVYSYAAQGLMVRSGLDPYSSGVAALVTVPTREAARALAAVDPTWRSAPSPYGPLATMLEHLAVAISGGNPLGAVVVLRAVAVGCVIAIGVLVVQLAGHRPTQALILIVLNPLVLLHLVSGAHLEAPMCALLLGALVAAKRGHWAWAVVLACAAGSTKAPAFAAVLAIAASHALTETTRAARLQVAARDVALAALTITGFTVLVPNGLGWVNGLNSPAQEYSPFAPASLVGKLLSPVVPAASFDDLATAGRLSCLLAAAGIVGYLVATSRRRTLEHSVGYSLVALALLSPTIYPWYLLWGLVCLAPSARGRLRNWLVLGCGVTAVAAITGAPRAVTASFDAVAVVVGAAIMWRVSAAARAAPDHAELPSPARPFWGWARRRVAGFRS